MTMDPSLGALVELSATLAAGPDVGLRTVVEEAVAVGDPMEVEEALLQSYLFLGYPAALTGFAAWRRAGGGGAPPAEPSDPEGWMARGQETCRAVYGDVYEDLRANIAGLSRDMDRSMVSEGYGRVLGRPGLALHRRECCIVAILAVQGYRVQLESHLRGALRTGAPPSLVDEVLERALRHAPPDRHERAREAWRRVLARWENA